jgi:hypothetical protein
MRREHARGIGDRGGDVMRSGVEMGECKDRSRLVIGKQ